MHVSKVKIIDRSRFKMGAVGGYVAPGRDFCTNLLEYAH